MAGVIGPHNIDLGISLEDSGKIQDAIIANLHGIGHHAPAHLVGIMEGLIRGMPPEQRMAALEQIKTSGLSTIAQSLVRNSEEADQVQNEFNAKRARELKKLREEMDAPDDKANNAFKAMLRANITSAEALAAAAVYLGGASKISAAWAEYANRRAQTDAAEVVLASLSSFAAERASSGRWDGNMQRGVSMSESIGPDFSHIQSYVAPHFTVPRELAGPRWTENLERQWQAENQDWDKYNPERAQNATPVIKPEDRDVIDKYIQDNPGASYDPKTRIVTTPGDGRRVLMQDGKTVVLETREQSEARLKELEERRQRAIERGETLAEDGKTFIREDGSKYVMDPKTKTSRPVIEAPAAAMSRVTKAEETGQSLLEKERARIAALSRLPNVGTTPNGNYTPVPISPKPKLHIDGEEITPDVAGVIHNETLARQRRIEAQNSLQTEQRDLAIAAQPKREDGSLDDRRVKEVAPKLLPEQTETRSWSDTWKSWFGRNATTDRMDRYTSTDTTNGVIAKDVKKEDEQSWLQAKAGAIRKSWNAYQDRADAFWENFGWKKSEQEKAQELDETAKWAHRFARKWTWGQTTPQQEAEEARRKLEADKAKAAGLEPPKAEPETPGLATRAWNYMFGPKEEPKVVPEKAPVVTGQVEPEKTEPQKIDPPKVQEKQSWYAWAKEKVGLGDKPVEEKPVVVAQVAPKVVEPKVTAPITNQVQTADVKVTDQTATAPIVTADAKVTDPKATDPKLTAPKAVDDKVCVADDQLAGLDPEQAKKRLELMKLQGRTTTPSLTELRAGLTTKKLMETIQGQDITVPDAANAEPKVTTLKSEAAIEAEKQRAEAIAAKAKQDEKAKCGPKEETVESVPVAAATDKKAPETTVAAVDPKKDEKKEPPKVVASADDKPKPKVAGATMSA